MIHQKTTAALKRIEFRKALKSGKLLKFPGAFSPLAAIMIEKKQFEGVYISGAVLANDLGLPDIGMTTLTEVSQRGYQIARSTNLPAIIDIDTGFGEPMSAFRTIRELDQMGIAGCHIEDQINPKRCGHLDNKQLASKEDVVKKIKAAVKGKLDDNFLVIARTDARAQEGLDKAIDRAKAYIDAGAEMIFPEALQDEKEFETFRSQINVPLLANMTEFGKSKLLSTKTLEGLGYNLVIYPVTGLRLAMQALSNGLDCILREGSQESIVGQMQTRSELYNLIDYEDYNQFDQDLFNFKLSSKQ